MTFSTGRWWLCVEWGPANEYGVHPFLWLRPGDRFVGLRRGFYDGPFGAVGFWFFLVSWWGFGGEWPRMDA